MLISAVEYYCRIVHNNWRIIKKERMAGSLRTVIIPGILPNSEIPESKVRLIQPAKTTEHARVIPQAEHARVSNRQ